jgi:ATP-dependent exoDNAse (exonuclease V) beta subunit
MPAALENSAFPVNKGHASLKKVDRLWDRARKKIRQLCEMESASAYNYYIEIFDRVQAGLKAVSAKDDVLFLEALNREARILFDEESDKFTQLPELYCRLALRFKHFLIDEFQDTSVLQWKNLYLMVENVLSTDGSLFYVGDKKQAIYRFRGGEVALIDEVKERFKGFKISRDTLIKNYRSEKQIVEFNNTVFSPDNIARFLQDKDRMGKGLELNPAEKEQILNVFRDSRQTHKEDLKYGYVKSEFIDVSDSGEAEDILKGKLLVLVGDLKKRFKPRDIAILARKNDDVQLLTSWLLEKGIPAESEKTLNIRQNPYIKELVSFLKFLNSPIDNLSFASFISGEIFSSATGIESQVIQDFIFSLRDKPGGGAHLYREFRHQFPDQWNDYVEDFFKSVGFVPLYELTVSIFARFGLMKNLRPYQGFFMKFLELIKEQEEENSGISDFLEFFDKTPEEDLYVNVTEGDSIKILTIHKSKGLEFGAVILPFLEISPRPSKEVFVQTAGEIRLWHLKKRFAEFSPTLEKLYREQYLKSLIDELNNAYVAFTRPRKELYIFMSPKAGRDFNLAPLLLPQMCAGQAVGTGSSENSCLVGTCPVVVSDRPVPTDCPVIEIPPSEYKGWIDALKDEFIDQGILLKRDKVLKGKVLHYILSFVGNTSGKDKAAMLKEALEEASVEFPFVDNLKGYEKTVSEILDKQDLRRFFDVPGAEVYQEKEIVNSRGDTKRVDRLIVKPGEVLVVDYKSTKDEPQKHRQQVGEYVQIIRSIYPKSQVRGFLIYLDEASAEETDG